MSLETVRLSKRARDELIALKRHSGIVNWNTLCRWALCRSLAEPSIPPSSAIPGDSEVEMTWRTFGGPHADIYLALIRARCHRDGLGTDDKTVETQFRLHLHRGIGYLFGDRGRRGIDDLARLAVNATTTV